MSSHSSRSRHASSRSTDSGRQPKWRSSRLSAPSQPATSISKVFAQPLQGSPLRSAIDTVASLDDAASVYSEGEMAHKRERSYSNVSSSGDAASTSAMDAGSTKQAEAAAASSGTERPAQAAVDERNDHDITHSSPQTESPRADADSRQPSSLSLQTSAEVVSPMSTDSSTPIPFPVSLSATAQPQSSASSRSSPKSTSWFASLSRISLSSATPEPGAQKDTASSAIPESNTQPSSKAQSISIPAPTPPQQPGPSPASPSQTSPSQSLPTTRPTSPRTESGATSAISSVDDEVPPHDVPFDKLIESKDKALAHKLSLPTLATSGSSVSSLNPSNSSRFMLRIPLLGRPKMPLDQVVARAASDEERPAPKQDDRIVESSAPSDPSGPASQTNASTPVPEVVVSLPSADDLAAKADSDILNHVASPSSIETQVAPPTTGLTASPDAMQEGSTKPSEPGTGQPTADVVSPSSSWWGYLGWSASASDVNVNAAAAGSSEAVAGAKDTVAEPSSASTSLEQTAGPESAAAPADDGTRRRTISEITPVSTPTDSTRPSQKRHSSEISRAEVKEIHVKEDKKPTASLFSADTSKSQGSAWYSPWSWYAGSPVVPSSSTLTPKASDSNETLSGKMEGHQKTASEMVKEDALARDNATTPPSEPQPQPGSPSADAQPKGDGPVSVEETRPTTSPQSSTNPIESTISTNRSGWASFFMSKALLMKSVTDGEESAQRDANGMEVMDIEDDDEAEQPAENAAAGSTDGSNLLPTAAQAISIVVGKKKQPSSSPSSPRSTESTPPPPRREREPKKSGAPAPPLTNSESIKKETTKPSSIRAPSPTPSKTSVTSPRAQPPNLVLPTWNDIFLSPPRSIVPPPPTPPATQKGKIGKTLQFVSGVLFSGKDGKEGDRKKPDGKGKGKEREEDSLFVHHGSELPKALEVLGSPLDPAALHESCRVVVIGVAGWSPGAVTRTLAGGLPSSSAKFVDMACAALEKFEEEHGFKFKKVTKIPLEGDGTIQRKVAKVHDHLFSNQDWLDDLHAADVVFVATHSQGSIVSTHLIEQLIREGHILTEVNMNILTKAAASIAPGGVAPSHGRTRPQKVCCLALCGIHLGPLRYLRTSSLLQPYIQYFENAAARELFDFQNTQSEVSQNYVKALQSVMDHGTKMVYIASLNDQVVPIYSGIFAAASHPRILRALYIDGDAYNSSDFLSNLLVLLIRILNSGLSDSGLLTHLSEATAGTLSGVGHSTAYEELATYSLAVNYLFLTNDGGDPTSGLTVEEFNAVDEQNDYEIPWSLRDLIADDRVAYFFAKEFAQLRDAFDDWSPKTSILRDIKRKLQPIQRLSSIKGSAFGSRL